MATPPSDESKLLFKLMIDRDWHFYNDIRDQIARTVPPGRALRKYHTDLQGYARKAGKTDPNYQGNKSQDEKIAFGKSAVAIATISGWRRGGVLLTRGEGRGRQIKVRGGWTSNQFPGYEQELEPDPVENAGGYTDLPPGDSEPSEGAGAAPEAAMPFGPPWGEDKSKPLIHRVQDWAEQRMAAPVEALHVQRSGEQEWQVVDPPPVSHGVSPEGGVLATSESVQFCEFCGLVIGDPAVHSKWHESQAQPDTPPEMALLNESQLRLVVRSELATVLDQFQVGMQNHIDVGFAQLEALIGAVGRLREKWTRTDGL